MNESPTGSPSAKTLLKSAFIAAAAALIATLLFVMPAEYGIDPTGAGDRLGLLALYDAADEAADEPVTRTVTGTWPGIPENFDFYDPEVLGAPFSIGQQSEFRSETLTIRLDEFEQVEYKAVMRQGDAIVYSWSVEGGIVYTDFHADPGENAEGYPDQYFIRYRESESASDAGSLVAPFAGNHGWYWLNIEEGPITITLKVAGYYDSIDELFRSFQ